MVAIARALLTNPRLVVMDEPSEGLAPVVVDQLVGVLRALPGEGIGLLLVEQNLGVATEVCGTLAVMVNGRIAVAMPSRALLEDEAAQRRFLGVGSAGGRH
jgi:branched-chain amino acid transport system ATP-binding protein